jgi:hypothetical protein
MNMSKLEIIKTSLDANPEVVVGNVVERNYRWIGGYSHGWKQTVDIWVAPKTPLYTGTELQEFMERLVPEGLEPTQQDNFFPQTRSLDGLSMGKLYFDEPLGAHSVIRDRVYPHRRRTWVRPFPSTTFVDDLVADAAEDISRVLSYIRPHKMNEYVIDVTP